MKIERGNDYTGKTYIFNKNEVKAMAKSYAEEKGDTLKKFELDNYMWLSFVAYGAKNNYMANEIVNHYVNNVKTFYVHSTDADEFELVVNCEKSC